MEIGENGFLVEGGNHDREVRASASRGGGIRRWKGPWVVHDGRMTRSRAGCNQLWLRPRYGQIYPAPPGALKQPTDSGNTCLGNHNTTSGTKIVNAIAAKKMI